MLLQQSSRKVQAVETFKVAMKSCHKSNKLLYKVDKCKMMIQNAMLRKEIKDLKAKIDALELEQNRLQTIDQKCVSTKSDAKRQYSLSKSCLYLFGISSTIDQHRPCCNSCYSRTWRSNNRPSSRSFLN